jgi:hypothetical protein
VRFFCFFCFVFLCLHIFPRSFHNRTLRYIFRDSLSSFHSFRQYAKGRIFYPHLHTSIFIFDAILRSPSEVDSRWLSRLENVTNDCKGALLYRVLTAMWANQWAVKTRFTMSGFGIELNHPTALVRKTVTEEFLSPPFVSMRQNVLTCWSDQFRHHFLVISEDGRNPTYKAMYVRLTMFL